MAYSNFKALWGGGRGGLSSDQKKELAAIAAEWHATRRTSSSEADAEHTPMTKAAAAIILAS